MTNFIGEITFVLSHLSKGGGFLKLRMANIILFLSGVGLIIGVFTLDINGILGFLLTLIGLTVIGIGLFRGNKPSKVIAAILEIFLP